MKAKEIVEYILEIAPFKDSFGEIPHDDGFVFGNPDMEVKGIGVTWSPTLPVLQKAVDERLNFIITHEFLFWPHQETVWFKSEKDIMKKLPNYLRKKILEENQITVYMTHKNWDAAPEWGMCDSFPKFLGFEKEITRGRFTRVHQIQPVKLKELAEMIKEKMNLPVIRVAGNMERKVSKVGTACGGLGQIFGIPEELHRLGAEVVVFGEVLDYTVRCCLEHGMSAIETSHILSENPGVENLSIKLKEKFPEIKILFLDAGYPFQSFPENF